MKEVEKRESGWKESEITDGETQRRAIEGDRKTDSNGVREQESS